MLSLARDGWNRFWYGPTPENTEIAIREVLAPGGNDTARFTVTSPRGDFSLELTDIRGRYIWNVANPPRPPGDTFIISESGENWWHVLSEANGEPLVLLAEAHDLAYTIGGDEYELTTELTFERWRGIPSPSGVLRSIRERLPGGDA